MAEPGRVFDRFAEEVGVPRVSDFRLCRHEISPVPRITQDTDAARQAGGRGTPTIIINGRLLWWVPDSVGLSALVKKALGSEGEWSQTDRLRTPGTWEGGAAVEMG